MSYQKWADRQSRILEFVEQKGIDKVVRFCTVILFFALSMVIAFGGLKEKQGGAKLLPVLTHADASVILAKYAGFFDRYVAPDASVNDCVAFLNREGVYFGLMEVVNGSEFTQSDFARSMGQITLVLAGDAEYEGGKVKLPNGIASWKDFCTMNGVGFAQDFQAMLKSFQLLMRERVE